MAFSAKKVVLVGDAKVGKSKIIACWNGESADPVPTLGVSVEAVNIKYMHEKLPLSVWDTAGGEEHQITRQLYIQHTICAVLVFSVTSRESFTNLEKWYDEVTKAGVKNIIVAANKSDLEGEVSFEEAREWANEKKIERVISTSAVSGKNISVLMEAIGQLAANSDKPEEIERVISAQQKRFNDAHNRFCNVA